MNKTVNSTNINTSIRQFLFDFLLDRSPKNNVFKQDNFLYKNLQKQVQKQTLKSAVSLYSFSPDTVAHPTTEEEIIQIIQEAAQQNLKVRTIGSLHSAAPIPATDGVCIVLDKYKNLVNIEGSLVTVQAGMKIWELNEILAEHNLALPTLGTIAQQTVSGAISTGTHGGSLYYKSLSGYVQTLRLIRADGSILEVDNSQDIFNAVVISMGLLGIISTVTFKCVPAFSLQSQVISLSMDTFIQQFDDINRDNKYVDIRYSPITDKVQIVLINPTEKPIKQNGGWYPVKTTKLERRITDFINKFAQRLFENYKLNWLQRWCIQQYDQTVYSSPFGRSDFVLTHFDSTSVDITTNEEPDDFQPVGDMEIAIPYSQACAALNCIRNHFHKTQKYPTMHIHIRCTAADNFWLSPAYNQAICWLEFWEYPHNGKFFQEMLELLKPFNFRCHWGKQIAVDQKYLKQQYEKWHDFIHIRQQWDTNGIFSNSCLESYFS
ncbi:MAG: D-arabinono-1,4-lactone oxidase [Nostocaceae cyanobacterium]|nr:D-arabinono-1,4-lactone oxidase [Nostocaceae cyanobacterium]